LLMKKYPYLHHSCELLSRGVFPIREVYTICALLHSPVCSGVDTFSVNGFHPTLCLFNVAYRPETAIATAVSLALDAISVLTRL
jgi:hypothetical protein